MSSYEYRKERFRKMKDAWQFEKMHDLLIHKMPPENLLNELRFSIMLYISKAFYFDFTTEEDEFVRRLDESRQIRDNVTPNGGVVPKKEYQLEYNMVLRSWSRIVDNLTKGDQTLLTKFRMTPNIRIKFGKELEENLSRPLSTSYPHSDSWVEGPWCMNCFIPLLGDVKNNNLKFWKPKNEKSFSDDFLSVAATYGEMQWVLDHYQVDNTIQPLKGHVHLSDYALIHATSRADNSGTRVSIDTTILVGDHDVHPDREPEYLDKLEIVGEDFLVVTGRSIEDDFIVDKRSTFGHYTTGNLKILRYNDGL